MKLIISGYIVGGGSTADAPIKIFPTAFFYQVKQSDSTIINVRYVETDIKNPSIFLY